MKIILTVLALCVLSSCATIENRTSQLAIEPVESANLINQADAAYKQSDWSESEQLYIKLARDYPRNGLYWYRLGNIYSITNRTDAAVVAYKKSLRLKPADPEVWFNLGMIQLKQSAYTFNSMQVQLSPDNPLNEKAQKLLDGILELLRQK